MATAEFSKFAGILSAALSQHHLSGFEIAGISSPPLALFIVVLPKSHLTSHSRNLVLGEGLHHHGYLGHEDFLFVCLVLLCILATSSYLLLLSVMSIPFLSFLCPSLHEMFPWYR